MNINDIRDAAARIKPYVKRTPLERSTSLSERFRANVFVKYELFQRTGSFKARGGFNKLLQLSDDDKTKGVVAVSGGNHAQAVAYVSNALGIDVVIAMPANTPATYLNATRGYGATVELMPNIAHAFSRANELAAAGRTLIHPFDDDDVIAGQGTIGLEILEDVPDVTDVIVSIGGGGLAAGVARAMKETNSSIKMWAVETIGADAMSQAVTAGTPVELPAITSIAKTLGAPYVTERTLTAIQRDFEGVTVVSDAEAVRELLYIAERLKVIVEPAASATVAAAERLRANFGENSNVVIILCGGNTSITDACGYLPLLAELE
ncbi:MAG: threonine/serine dehydratase [Blastocatellia bacterium]|nr:threonine/serine dehydratase [Blastocatellia bacterium]